MVAAIDPGRGAQRLHQFDLVLPPTTAMGFAPSILPPELHREHPQAAGRAPHQHIVAGGHLRLVHEHPVRGEVGQPRTRLR